MPVDHVCSPQPHARLLDWTSTRGYYFSLSVFDMGVANRGWDRFTVGLVGGARVDRTRQSQVRAGVKRLSNAVLACP